MGSGMLKFTKVGQDYPAKRPAPERDDDFLEIARPFIVEKAEEQSSRCSQCGVPFCQVHCPLHNNIPDWLMLTSEGRLEEAHAAMAATSTMPEICGRICPQDRLCEGNCVIQQSGHGAVTIGSVEKFVTDLAWEEGWVEPIRPARDRSHRSIGIIGAGPAGLTAAELLRRRGYAVTVYDRHDRGGGLLTYGIPGFKLEKYVVGRRLKRLEDGGIRFRYDFEVGRDASLAELRSRHDALLIATGVYQARELSAPGVGSGGIVRALDYLIASNRKGFGDKVPDFESGQLNADGKRVVVIGGGDTAMDCVRTAVRQGATSVKCLYRRDRDNMPGSAREVQNAEEEGVEFVWLAAPAGFEADGDAVSAVRGARMKLGTPGPDGRRQPEPGGEAFREPADLVVTALGFSPEDLPTLFGASDLGVTRWGTLRTDHKTMMTSVPGVFAAGDIVRGASLVVWAIRDGRDVAGRMHDYLLAEDEAEKEAA
ncbi:Glutamate synthase [NADPH] small chain [Pacificimonas flava]|uniref:Glutamate synthase [NADPH] small chain n=2 Tax=Pacificimonas flava TaxID=1234595 RepID=M2T5V6_9SPHN|nr:Glutamate synthase [NADPH] small chain [Pacificimonas flava]